MTASTFAGPSPQSMFAAGQDAFEVLIQEWGTSDLDSFPFLQTVAGIPYAGFSFPNSLQAVSIGPRSTMDRCWLSWNSQERVQGPTAWFARALSVDSPLLFSQAAGKGSVGSAPVNPFQTAMLAQQLYAFPRVDQTWTDLVGTPGGILDTVLPATILKADGTARNFYNPPANVNFERPHLHLIFHFKNFIAAATRRAPYMNTVTWLLLGNVATEQEAYGYCVAGRKRVALQCASQVAGTVIRVAALLNVNSQQTIDPQEVTVGQKTVTNANESIGFNFCDLNADFLLVYATFPGGGFGQQAVRTTIVAYD